MRKFENTKRVALKFIILSLPSFFSCHYVYLLHMRLVNSCVALPVGAFPCIFTSWFCAVRMVIWCVTWVPCMNYFLTFDVPIIAVNMLYWSYPSKYVLSFPNVQTNQKAMHSKQLTYMQLSLLLYQTAPIGTYCILYYLF